MADQYTANYQLCQWAPEDAFNRAEFNQDNARVDAALHDLETGKAEQTQVDALSAAVELRCRMTTGTFVGVYQDTITVNLPFAPEAVLVERADGRRDNSSYVIGGLVLAGYNLGGLASISGSKLIVTNTSLDTRYHYVAWG